PFSTKVTKAAAADDKGKTGGKSGASGKLLDRPASGKGGAGRTQSGGAGRTQSQGKGGKGRRPVTPVRVSQGRNWGPIAMFAGAGLVALLIIIIAAIPVLRKANQG